MQLPRATRLVVRIAGRWMCLWRAVDQRARQASAKETRAGIGRCQSPWTPRDRFVDDSPQEGDGFEPSVPHKMQPFLAAAVRSRNSPSATKARLFRAGDRWFESISLLR